MKIKGVLVVIVLAVFVSACVGQSNPYKYNIGNQAVTFRANLDRAKEVPISNATSIQNLLFSSSAQKIYVAYVPDNRSNSLYLVTGYELSYKMIAIQNTLYGNSPKIEGMTLNSTDEAYKMTSIYTPVILMRAGSDRTAVSFDRNLVLVEGKDMTENGRDYTDMDLAADKLLLALLGV